MIRAYLGLGGNLGNPLETLQHALISIRQHPDIVQVALSGFYQTEPVNMAPVADDLRHKSSTSLLIKAQDALPWFINTVIAIDTMLSASELLSFCLDLEHRFGRIRASTALANQPKGYLSRTLDIDVLFYGNYCINTDDLQIPHPRLHERAFVLVPMAEIAPNYCHPQLGQSIQTLLEALGPPLTGVQPVATRPDTIPV
jgi:2-amino-4-hydroxy-6-hydroxymethyldihydropteridine diphosphokinase